MTAIHRAPLSPADRRACYAHLAAGWLAGLSPRAHGGMRTWHRSRNAVVLVEAVVAGAAAG